MKLKLDKFKWKREHEYDVNLRKRLPGEAVSYLLRMSFWKVKF